MKTPAITAFVLLSLATSTGCVLEVESESEAPVMWAEAPLTAEDDQAPLMLGDDPLLESDRLPADAESYDAPAVYRDGTKADSATVFANGLPEGDPAPDPWH